jgi:hypothetical protein
MYDVLKKVDIREIHRRLGGSRLHTSRDQMVMDVNSLREVAGEIPFIEALLQDLSKPQIYNDPCKLAFYGGALCILNVLRETHDKLPTTNS